MAAPLAAFNAVPAPALGVLVVDDFVLVAPVAVAPADVARVVLAAANEEEAAALDSAVDAAADESSDAVSDADPVDVAAVVLEASAVVVPVEVVCEAFLETVNCPLCARMEPVNVL
jgi:hypothetical protein